LLVALALTGCGLFDEPQPTVVHVEPPPEVAADVRIATVPERIETVRAPVLEGPLPAGEVVVRDCFQNARTERRGRSSSTIGGGGFAPGASTGGTPVPSPSPAPSRRPTAKPASPAKVGTAAPAAAEGGEGRPSPDAPAAPASAPATVPPVDAAPAPPAAEPARKNDERPPDSLGNRRAQQESANRGPLQDGEADDRGPAEPLEKRAREKVGTKGDSSESSFDDAVPTQPVFDWGATVYL
jgi:hypothetical protein